MQISTGKVVSIDYTLKDDQENVIDSSIGGEPLTYLHGVGQLVPGLEKELEGKTGGASFTVTIPPAEGYGQRDDSRLATIPKDQIEGADALEVGAQLYASTEHGEQIVTVTRIEGDEVTIDGNHPLAGENLHFEVTVRDVREASEDEIAHGHVHGPGGHHH
jgi:FKBP-type peptidyl-prolyl cis-trans isomerase SlyD